MVDIICDTNIWYSIGNGLIKKEDLNNKSLAVHWLSIGELSMSNKNLTNPDLLLKALISALKESKRLYQYPPLNHIAYLIDTKHMCETKMQTAIAALIIQLNNSIPSDSNNIASIKEKYHEGKKEIVQRTNKNSLNLKRGIRNKNVFMTTDNGLAIRKYLAAEVNNYFEADIFNINTFDWKKLELYEGSMKMLSKMLISGQTILKENDLVDIFQLVYVQPGNLFWTRDNKLKNIIKAASLEHYLFEK